jgi:hypothetical protein
MTRNGALCNDAGEIGAHEFEKIMRGEVITYLQVFLSLQFIVASDSKSLLVLSNCSFSVTDESTRDG